ncbi:dihydrofolate reductase family protein [Protaetiibacter mangrovi]|uniref:Dihydrofolate reductase family protein n=1 Tax=Protaetiibacter mangrovi TaxID=2970926 RepID=A0ABT1ZII9_9MICO|nr:dihydrofolate reductase family protein [Protaetiibacter mangrovi]MCS0500529.1 dihydrofolate reductase family protein [Protaetiibacter mangrovi]TPX02821.1 deaminase [Schumannella luteola]
MPAPLIYFSTVSLDDYREDADGRFDWSTPDDEVHAFINELFAPVHLHLYGRRNHDVMMFWDETDPDALEGPSREWGRYWQTVDKVIYSTTLTEVPMRRARLRSRFDADEVRRWKAESDAPIAIGGGALASEAARAGVLDELHLVVTPTLLGGGTPYLDHGIRLDLELLDEHRFAGGSLYLRYAVRHPS